MHVHSGGDGSRSAAEPAAVLSLSSVLVLSYQLVGGAGLERLRRVAELQLLVLTMTVLSSWLWWCWRVTAVTCCPAQCQLTTVWPAAWYWCTADSLALVPHWHHQHTGHTGCSQLTATSQHLQPHTGEAEAEHLASTGDTGDTGARRSEKGVLVAARALRVLGGL